MNSFQGNQGYCYIPYDYLTNSDLCFDVWTIRKVATDDFGQDHWDNDDAVDYRQTDDSNFDDDNNSIIKDIGEEDDDDDG